MIVYLLCFAILLVGIYGLLVKRDLVRLIIASGITGYATNLMLVLFGYKRGAIYPILEKGKAISGRVMVDPLPQALVLTSIVIELGITAMLVALAIRLFEKNKTFDITKTKRLSG
ncbi:MAG: NADH-quinone oxidoreductase subunit K [Candidatus Marinimicrobia bacterium]|nr:NADH-quinone oxidoreductase subunit K [Candidatus Neomarinimicrobiota bacterium]HOG75655.1 sodium:proton antiporter [Candidatus Neomarinimicrobiota bacterium]HQM36419.1 sodium:proton antiporter [Candidatus Neomarinimicrobiota bacterium]